MTTEMKHYALTLERTDGSGYEKVPLSITNGQAKITDTPNKALPRNDVFVKQLEQAVTNAMSVNSSPHQVIAQGDNFNVRIDQVQVALKETMTYRHAILTVLDKNSKRNDQVPIAVDQNGRVSLSDAPYDTVEGVDMPQADVEAFYDMVSSMDVRRDNFDNTSRFNVKVHLEYQRTPEAIDLSDTIKQVRDTHEGVLSHEQLANLIKHHCKREGIEIPEKAVPLATELKEILSLPNKAVEAATMELLTPDFSVPAHYQEPKQDEPVLTNSYRRAM